MLSDEQQLAVDLSRDWNVAISACAGAGKTTTCLEMVRGSTLLLTYNRSLMVETLQRVVKRKLNMDVFTYHAFAGKAFRRPVLTDKDIQKCLTSYLNREIDGDMQCKLYNTVILDEVQDMNITYYRLVKILLNYITEYSAEPRIILLGDVHQNIYATAGSDPRYLTLADQLYPGQWKFVTFSKSFRVPKAITDFINIGCLGGEQRIIGQVEGPKPRLIIGEIYAGRERNPLGAHVHGVDNSRGIGLSCHGCDDCKDNYHGCYNNHELIREIKYYLHLGYKPGDIFILAPYMGSNRSPFVKLGSYISRRNNELPPVYLCDDNTNFSDELAANKITMCTFHKSKGREREVVIIVGFDASMLFGNMQSPCPNHLYVALTRTRKHLTLFQSHRSVPLPFVQIGDLADVITYRSCVPRHINATRNQWVTKFIKFRSMAVVNSVLDLYTVECISAPETSLYPNSTTGQLYNNIEIVEDVSCINGLALDSYVSYRRGQPNTNYNFTDPINIRDYLQHITYVDARRSNFIRYNQISRYNWMTSKLFMALADRCEANIPTTALFHQSGKKLAGEGMEVSGECDALLPDAVFELKCVRALNDSHYLQTIVYMWMFGKQTGILYNAVDNSKYRITPKTPLANSNAARILYDSHVKDLAQVSDTQFLNVAHQVN